MGFTLPDFNLTLTIWNAGRDPRTDIPDATSQGQMYITPRPSFDSSSYTTPFFYFPVIFFRLPLAAPIEPNGWIAAPGSFGQFFLIRFVEQMHLGFPNEYRFCQAEQRPPPPTFTPPF